MPNLYMFDDVETDRHRLLLQAELFRDYLQNNAPQFLPQPPARILDIGCGVGHISAVLHEIYPQATVVGIDRNAQSIATASQQPRVGPGLSFVVGDIQEALPPGPFDLVYASMVLVHTSELARVVALVYAALAPGGTFWVKDMHPTIVEAGLHPDYQSLFRGVLAATKSAGLHPYIWAELPALLTATGFTAIRQEEGEVYPLGGASLEGEISLADAIAVFRNARHFVNRMEGTPVDDILRRCDIVIADAQAQAPTFGTMPFINILARRP